MKATTTQVAKTIRAQAISVIARKQGLSPDVVVGCLEAGHKRITAAFDAMVTAAIERTFEMVDSGHFELVTG